MKLLGARSLSSWLGSFLTVCWVISWCVVLVWVALPFLVREGVSFTFPAEIDSGLIEERAGPGGTWTLEATEVSVKTPPGRTWVGTLIGLPFLALFTFVLGRLRAIFHSLRDGSPFIPANARRLRSVGLAVLWIEVLDFVVTVAGINPLLEQLRPAAQGGAVLHVEASLDWTVVFLGLAVLVIAEVFRRGTQMQDEQALTV